MAAMLGPERADGRCSPPQRFKTASVGHEMQGEAVQARPGLPSSNGEGGRAPAGTNSQASLEDVNGPPEGVSLREVAVDNQGAPPLRAEEGQRG